MSSFCHSLLIALILQCKSKSDQLISVTGSILPNQIYGHSIGIYNHSLYIIGGAYNESFFSSSTYYSTIDNVNHKTTNISNIKPFSTWQTISNQFDSRYPFGFQCKGQCFTSINELIFVINPASEFFDEHGHVVIYNMQSHSFVNPSTFNNTLIYIEAGQCATNNGTHLFAIGSKCNGCSDAHSEIQSLAIDHDLSGAWKILGHLNVARYFSGCNVAENNLFVFGGYTNHNQESDKGNVSDHIERCDLSQANLTCFNISDHLQIARAQHQVVMTKYNFMFIIGGISRYDTMIKTVEIFNVSSNLMHRHEWFISLRSEINEFASFYDMVSGSIYIVGGLDMNESAVDTVTSLSVCQLMNGCYEIEINLQCGGHINGYIQNAHDIHSFYFEISADDEIISLDFDGCDSKIDTYIYLFLWNETNNEWQIGDDDAWHWDDAGECIGSQQEIFSIDTIVPGYYHLVISAHQNGNYSANFQCSHATTMEPTLEPTLNPTVVHYDRIWFLLSFVCQSNVNLHDIDLNAMILNGLLHALKPDLKFILHTDIVSNLTQFENEQSALAAISSKRRRLLAAENDVYFFQVDANITIGESYVEEGELCQSAFSYDFVHGLGENIDKAQIISLAECDSDLFVNTWNVQNNVINSNGSTIFNALPIIILFGIVFNIFLFSFFVSCVQSIDHVKISHYVQFCIYFLCVYADIFFVVYVWMRRYSETVHDEVLIYFGVIALFIVIVPFIKNIFDLNYHSEYWKNDFVHGEIIKVWLDKYSKIVYILSFVSCTTHGTLAIMNCKLCGLRMFSMALPPEMYQRFQKQRLWVIILSNIPQIIIQLVWMIYFGKSNEYGIFAFVMSLISICIYLYQRYVCFDYTDYDNKSMLFSFRISSVSIAQNGGYFYRNEIKKLSKFFSKSFEINSDKERCDLLPPVQYYDTDIGGLNIYILITSKIGKHQDFYLDSLEKSVQNESLKKKFQKIWNLPNGEEINIYRIDGITNTHSSVQMTDAHLSHHIKVNSGSLRVTANDFMDDDEDDDDDTDYTEHDDTHDSDDEDRGGMIRTKGKIDFAEVNMDEDDDEEKEMFDDGSFMLTSHDPMEQYELGFTFQSINNDEYLE